MEEALGADNEMPVLMDDTEQIRLAYGVEVTPTQVLIDAEGGIAAVQEGAMTSAEMEALLEVLP